MSSSFMWQDVPGCALGMIDADHDDEIDEAGETRVGAAPARTRKRQAFSLGGA